MDRSPSNLDAHLGYWLRFVSNHVSHAFMRKLATRDVTAAEWVLLRVLHDHAALAPSAAAEAMGMTRGAISKLADRLAAKNLLIRSRSEGDQRYQAISLTPQGRALVPQLAVLADENDAEFFGHLTGGERGAIQAMLIEIVRSHGLTDLPVD